MVDQLERWPRQRATDREVWANRQQRGGKRESWERDRQTKRQRARQTKGPSARDRQTSNRKPTERCWYCVSQAGHVRRGLYLSLSVRVSAGISGSLGLSAHWVCIYPFSWEFVFSTPCPLPVNLPVCVPSQCSFCLWPSF